ncbi:MAG: ISNCY family transposase [Desulfobacteraceae bacterium]|jgi:IS5 family transposase
MRKRILAQRTVFDHAIDLLIEMFKPSKKLTKMNAILDANPHIVAAVHADLTEHSTDAGSHGMSAERIVRCAVLKQYKQYSYRELWERLKDGVSLRWFTRFYSAPIPHYTTLQKAIKSIRAETWTRINEALLLYAQQRKLEKGKSLRVDTTVVQSNIAYPLDSRLLWDSIRVLTRLMERSRQGLPELHFAFAKRTRRAKKLCYRIVMAKGPKAKHNRHKFYKDLIKIANEVFLMAERCLKEMSKHPQGKTLSLYEQLDHYLSMSAVAIDQCERRVLKREKVPASEKILSIFEQHTDIIKRGKSQSPTEFGHKVLISTAKSGLITQYQVFRGNPDDAYMIPDILTMHQKQYGHAPDKLCGDRRFFSLDNEQLAYQEGVKKVSICKPGYRSRDRKQIEKERWFKTLQRFRAGIEGIISALMRSYGLKRCLWKGWQAFQSYVGLSVVTFNLQKIAQLI